MSKAHPPLLEAEHLTKRFRASAGSVPGVGRRTLTAVDDVSLTIGAGEVVAVVGESGSGKSTVARVLAQLDPQTDGTVRLDGRAVQIRGHRAFRRYCAEVQLTFQDPFASLNPLRTVRYHLLDPLRIHGRTGDDPDAAVADLLRRVNLDPPERFVDRYPHELSGGQRQRVSIARALAAGARVLLADEPVSMLDVSIRLGVLNLLSELKDDGLAILYITHDIASARHFADRILVMYAGQIVESGDSESVTQDPQHPYTRLLIDSAPDPDTVNRTDPRAGSLATAEPPSLIDPPSGCRFHPRCPFAAPVCAVEAPAAFDIGGGRHASCWAHAGTSGRTDLPRLPDQVGA